MNVSLTPALEEFVNQKVSSGKYGSASEVVHDALRLLEDRDHVRQMRFEELRKEIAIGIEQLERGEYTTFDENTLDDLLEEVKTRGRQQLAERRATRAG